MTYSDKLIDHFTNPRNVGSLDESSPRVGTGVVGSPVCGDVMKFQIEVDAFEVHEFIPVPIGKLPCRGAVGFFVIDNLFHLCITLCLKHLVYFLNL